MATDMYAQEGNLKPQDRLGQAAETVKDESQSVAHLLGELVADAQHLVRKEFELARTEVRQEINKAQQGAISLGIGVGVLAMGGIMLLLMLVYLLADVFTLELWISYLIVGAVLAIIGTILLLTGRSRLQQIDPKPEATIDEVRKDAQWLKEQMPSGKK
ncbi:MAG: phage holin family protein [Chloroflexaceae bacterium]|nr:phage holin family protein [Chloroflexaceae bacterium]NJL32549.1 phage holin family protein [Chloroflexaceae bacterium]NJO04889.1 phage holin family protein [Chloroflexaceae bacterium]NJO84494.1 phage holin family protein [Blastochloris sp.]